MAGTFALDISRFCKGAKADVKLAIQKITMEAFKRVVLRTPVDTGRARANWSVSEGSPVTYSVSENDKSGTATLRKASDGVEAWECTGSIFLANNLAYIAPLEFGHSGQAPNGMVRITVAEMQAWCRSASNVKQGIGSIKRRE
jgi:hypothetical protein